ncbi:unnamed protein product [Moneuplotes crassus]|uniref:B box-type domain-containing protein n=1 Tax=Euplotes crassus TaxID=5936 RepID=A0AAD1XBW0_EUPCR|nr:unnamed protein product [Moneuplotes crassus]
MYSTPAATSGPKPSSSGLCPEHPSNRRATFCSKCKLLLCMKCFTAHHIDHEFLLVDSFGEKLISDLEERKKIKDKILKETSNPEKDLFGPKTPSVKRFVKECRKRLQAAVDSIQASMDNNDLVQILSKRKDYFALIRDTSTILGKLNKLCSEVRKKKEQEGGKDVDTDATEGPIEMVDVNSDKKTDDFVSSNFDVSKTMNHEDCKTDDPAEKALKNERSKKSSMEDKVLLDTLKLLESKEESYLIFQTSHKQSPSGIYLFNPKNNTIKAKVTFSCPSETLLNIEYVRPHHRVYFLLGKFTTSTTTYTLYEYHIPSRTMRLLYLDKPSRPYYTTMVQSQNLISIIQVNYQTVSLSLPSCSFTSQIPPLLTDYGTKTQFNPLCINSRYIYILVTHYTTTEKYLFACDTSQNPTQWKSFNFGHTMHDWGKFCLVPILDSTKILVFGEARLRKGDEHVYVLDLVSGEIFKAYEKDYLVEESEDFRGNQVVKWGKRWYCVGQRDLYVFDDDRDVGGVKKPGFWRVEGMGSKSVIQ